MLELERVRQLRDSVLIDRLTRSAKADRQLTVRLLAELGEVQARGLFRDLGFSSMFEYATRKLGMSEAEAALRLRVAKLARSFPVVLEMLGRSEVTLTTLSLLAPVLTADTLQLLHEARFKSKQQVLELLVKYIPKPDVPDSIRRLPSPRPSAHAPRLQPVSQPLSPLSAAAAVAPAPIRTTAAAGLATLSPLAASATLAPAPTLTTAAAGFATPSPLSAAAPLAPAPTHTTAAAGLATPSPLAAAATLAPAPTHTTAAAGLATPSPLAAAPTLAPAPTRATAAAGLATPSPLAAAPTLAPAPTRATAAAGLATPSPLAAAPTLAPAPTRTTAAAGLATLSPLTAAPTLAPAPTHAAAAAGFATPSPLSAAATLAPASTRNKPGEVLPLSPGRHKISFTASQRVRELLEQARDLRRHRYPSGDLEPLFEQALELLIAHEKKRQCGQTATPRTQPAAAANPYSRYISRALRRRVWARDGGQCCFIAPEGVRCQARSRLEFHHLVAFARGGLTREDNIVLLCKAHNALLAERDYGRSWMQARIVQARIASGASGVIRGLETLPP